MRLIPTNDLDLTVVPLQGLVHGEVGGCGQALDLPVLAGLQLEHLEEAVVAPACDVALLLVPADAFQLGVVGYGNLIRVIKGFKCSQATKCSIMCL